MIKKELFEEFLELIYMMQKTAFDLIDKKKYNEIGEFMDDIFTVLSEEKLQNSFIETKLKGSIVGKIDKQKAMIDIGDNQGLMIFGEENDHED